MTVKRLWIVDPSLKDFVGHHFEYDAATLEGAAARGYVGVCLGHRSASDLIAAQLAVRPTFSHDIWGTPAAEDPTAAANAVFLSELAAAAPPAALGPDDIVFGHMITRRQFFGFAGYAERMAAGRGQLVLLLRYEPAHYDHPLSDEAAKRLRAAIGRGVRVRLASDSGRLADQFERLYGLPVEVLPIPHTGRLRAAAAAGPEGRPLHVVSLGNARDEKGLLDLFNAVRILKLRGDQDRFRFTFQVNDPTPLLVPAITQYAAEGHSDVCLLHAPLESDAYYALLQDADIVALPYWRAIYEARTSGVLLEALAAAKPVICTADTWMSDQVEATGAGRVAPDRDATALAKALVDCADDYGRLAAQAAEAAPSWVATHNPQSFAAALIDGAADRPRARKLHAAVLYPWGDGLQRSSGASQRVNSLIDVLAESAAEVRVLQDTRHPPIRRGNVLWEAVPVLERASADPARQAQMRRSAALGAKNDEDIYLRLADAAAHDPALAERIDHLVRSSDIVFVEYPFWAPLVADAARRHGRPWVVTAHDILSDQVKHSPAWLRWATRRMELDGLKAADHVATLSVEDAQRLTAWGAPAEAIEVGLDTAALRPLPADVRPLVDALCSLPPDDLPLLLFVGSRYGPNQQAAQALRAMAPQLEGAARIIVVGACAEPETSGAFTALGRVDELTLRLLYQTAALVLAPMAAGTGASVKAVDALASGAPLMSTALGVRGVPQAAQAACLIENDLERWPALILSYLDDPTAQAQLRAAAQAGAPSFDVRSKLDRYLDWLPGTRPPRAAPPPYVERWVQLGLEAVRAAATHRLTATADALLTALLAVAPTHPDLLLQRARSVMRPGSTRPRDAARELRKALSAGADPVEVLLTQAELASEEGAAARLRAQAAQLAASHIVLTGEEFRIRDRLWRAFHAGERQWALALAREVITTWPEKAAGDYYYLASLIEFEAGAEDLDAAADWASRAVDLGFDPFWSWRLVGVLQGRRGQIQDARRAFGMAQALADGEQRAVVADGLQQLAWAAFQAQDLSTAAEIARDALEAAPAAAAAHYILAECARLSGQDPEIALSHYERAAELGYEAQWCLVQQGRLLLLRGDGAEGLKKLNAILQDPAAPDGTRRAALDGLRQRLWAIYNAGGISGAGDELRRTLTLEPALGDMRYLLGEHLSGRGAHLEAEAAYRQAEADGYDPYWCQRRAADALAAQRDGAPMSNRELELRLGAARLARRSADREHVLSPVLDERDQLEAAGQGAATADLEQRLADAGLDLENLDIEQIGRLAEQGRGLALFRALAARVERGEPLGRLLAFTPALLRIGERGAPARPHHVLALASAWERSAGEDREAAALLMDVALRSAATAGVGLRLPARRSAAGILAYARAEYGRLTGDAPAGVRKALHAAERSPCDRRRLARTRLLVLEDEALAEHLVRAPDTLFLALAVSTSEEMRTILDAVQRLAWSAFHAGAIEQALQLADLALAADETSAAMLYLAAEALQILHRDLDRAEQMYGEALANGFDPFWSRFNRAQARAKLGRPGAAREDLAAALEIAPDPDARARARASLDGLLTDAPV
ncbi:glycosyltransferase [Phenylobacterium sp. VNQ135]|uniref:glycosyltransferase n=1 Tax=Phenylobacterium sp. VNQ135 TaxID=3400922 RepID=UPI003C04E8BD